MVTIFINERPIYLTDSLEHSAELNYFNYKDIDVIALVKQIEREHLLEAYIYKKDLDSLLTSFIGYFKHIEAAGGIVRNDKQEYLFIYRNEVWDLPKGKLEKQEKKQEAAIREVEEETGVQNISIVKPLNNTYHMYTYKNERVFKTTYWFAMETSFVGQLYPQLEEGITRVEWLDQKEIGHILENTYANIRLLLTHFI